MVDTSNLIESIKNLESELRKSGKIETADFFNRALIIINSETDRGILRDFLKKLTTSGAMIQYSNFSYSEEMLFDKVYEDAKQLLDLL